jgi:hypothetical protein
MVPACHPEKRHYALGLCRNCWRRKRADARSPEERERDLEARREWRKRKVQRQTHRLELTGQTFGRLTAIKFVGVDDRGYALWECQCECGQTKIVKAVNLRLGVTRSCGCLQHEVCVARGRRVAAGNLLKAGIRKPDASFRDLLRGYRNNASKRGLCWELSEEDFKRLTSSSCFYTGLAPSQVWRADRSAEPYVYNGVDRIDSTKGYSVGNCVACAPAINKMKWELSQEQFVALCRLVAARFPESN